MSLEKFEQFKHRFINTKPIRGRTTEIKPIGQRRRDWEQVVKSWVVEPNALDMEGQEAYGAHLYRTDCLLYLANGDIHVKTGGWNTPTTTDFISRFLPRNMRCYKKYNKTWVEYQGQSYIIDIHTPTIFKYNQANDTYAVENLTPLLQKVVDRTKMKEAREKLNAFRNYASIMLKLSGGWISNELVEQYADPSGQNRDYWGRRSYRVGDKTMRSYELSGAVSNGTAKDVYEALCTTDETQFPSLLCMICSASDSLESRVVGQEQIERTRNGLPWLDTVQIREWQYDHKTIDNRINFFIKKACDVYTTKKVPLGKVVTNII